MLHATTLVAAVATAWMATRVGVGSQAGTGVPPAVTEALDWLSSEHGGHVRARELVLPPGQPLLETREADWLRALVERGADGGASAQGAALDEVVERCFREVDVEWPGSSCRSYTARVATTRAVRLCQWTDVDGAFSAAVLKAEGLDLAYLDAGPAVGPQVLARAPQVAHVVPDLLHALRPLPLSLLGRESLSQHEWRRVDGDGGGALAWRAAHPSAPGTVLRAELDRVSGLPVAASLSFQADGEAPEASTRMLCLIHHAPVPGEPGQVWVRRVVTLTCAGGGMAIEDVTLEDVDFAPAGDGLVLHLPSQAHLYDQRGAAQVYHGPRSPWPAAIADRVLRGGPSAAATRIEPPAPGSDAPARDWRRFLGGLSVAFGLLATFAPARRRRGAA